MGCCDASNLNHTAVVMVDRLSGNHCAVAGSRRRRSSIDRGSWSAMQQMHLQLNSGYGRAHWE